MCCYKTSRVLIGGNDRTFKPLCNVFKHESSKARKSAIGLDKTGDFGAAS